jgi:YHS domain-containing protein
MERKETTMTPIDDLSVAIDDLLMSTIARRKSALCERQDAMRIYEDRRAKFDAKVLSWMRDTVLPRLQILSGKFRHANPAELSENALRAAIHLPRTDEFPVDARINVQVVHDVGFEWARLIFEASIIPILMDYDHEGGLDLDVLGDDTSAVAGFIEDRILRFVADYLRVLDPESFYQKNLLVTDPVCGMTFRRTEAAAMEEFEGRMYHLCTPRCRERFVADPTHYVQMAHTLRSTGAHAEFWAPKG